MCYVADDEGSSTLDGNMVASSFGKMVMSNSAKNVNQEDIAIALLMMITNNIGQCAYLNAQLHKCPKIFFIGNFLRQNPISCRRLSFAINFWSKGKTEALFLEHEVCCLFSLHIQCQCDTNYWLLGVLWSIGHVSGVSISKCC